MRDESIIQKANERKITEIRRDRKQLSGQWGKVVIGKLSWNVLGTNHVNKTCFQVQMI